MSWIYKSKKDGTTVEVPDNIELGSQEFLDLLAKARSGEVAQAVIEPVAQEQPQVTEQPQQFDYGKQISGDLGAATRGTVAGLASPVTSVADFPVALLNQILPQDWQQQLPSQGLQSLLTMLGTPQAQTEAQRIMQAGTQGLAGSGALVGLGRALGAGAGQALAAQPAQQLGGGALGGAAGQTAQELDLPPEAQVAAGLAGGMTGSGLAGLKTLPTGGQAGLVKDAAKTGVRVMTSDVRPPNTFASKWLQATAEKIPLAGTGGVRQAQQQERVEAVRDILREYGADDVARASDAVMEDLASKRSADLSKWAKEKSSVIDGLSDAGVVPIDNTVKAIDDQIVKLSSLKTKEVLPIVDRLNDWKEAIQGQNLGNIELLRKQIGESFKAPELASVRSTGEKALSSIYAGIKQDMGDYIKANGEKTDYAKWMVANKQLSDLSGELKNNALASVLKRGDATPEVIQTMLFSKKPSEVATLYRNLTPEGQANARAAILAKAAEKAGQDYSPDKFVNEVKRLGASSGVFFTGEDADRLKGLVRVLDATKRAGQASVSPPTGVQAVIPAATAGLASFYGGGLEGFMATMATAGGVGGLTRIYESTPVRDILLKIPKTVAGSKEESALFKRLATVTNTQQYALGEAGKSISDRVREAQKENQ
jgi:hypothetical protein